ncbi:MAG: hypothetical protein KJ630_23125 [Proteobacteria bacterium]|nr:hypothetical protein [Pseudomonadota bacterium]
MNRMVVGRDRLLWVIIACTIPDLPWIVLTCFIPLDLFDPYTLRLYCTAQASLLLCLFFSAALACFTKQPGKIFIVLASNCLFHLVLDALEIKWGNGVHLIAPFSWKMMHNGTIWPGHPVILGFTLVGLLYLLGNWQRYVAFSTQLHLPGGRKAAIGLLLFSCYLFAPILFLEQLEEANTYNIHTLRMKDQRPGKHIEFDRVHYFAEQQTLQTFTGERIIVTGSQPTASGRVSFRGHFLTPTSFVSASHHYHRDQRDLATLLGLFMTCTLLLQSLILPHFQAPKNNQGPP